MERPHFINGGLDWVYPEELDLSTAFWWSPDSKSIAYLQFDSSREPVYPHEDVLGLRAVYEPERYPQAGEDNADVHFGIVGAAGGPTRWVEVGDTRFSYLIARAGWMPDSRNVYVIRTNRIQNKLEMLSINVESGMPASVFKESDPYWINLHGDVRFLADGKRFLWQSERDTGFNHIFLYSNDGREVKALTKGAWEVKGIAGVAPDRVYYTSDEGDSLETHLYSIKLDGGDKRRLDKTPGMHNVSMGPGGSYYLDTHSSLTEPPSTTLHSGDGAELGVYLRPTAGSWMNMKCCRPRWSPSKLRRHHPARPPDQASRIRPLQKYPAHRQRLRRTRRRPSGPQFVAGGGQHRSGLRAARLCGLAIGKPRRMGRGDAFEPRFSARWA